MNIQKKNYDKYILKLRKRLKNETVSIISNNCIGGILYHDFGSFESFSSIKQRSKNVYFSSYIISRLVVGPGDLTNLVWMVARISL